MLSVFVCVVLCCNKIMSSPPVREYVTSTHIPTALRYQPSGILLPPPSTDPTQVCQAVTVDDGVAVGWNTFYPETIATQGANANDVLQVLTDANGDYYTGFAAQQPPSPDQPYFHALAAANASGGPNTSIPAVQGGYYGWNRDGQGSAVVQVNKGTGSGGFEVALYEPTGVYQQNLLSVYPATYVNPTFPDLSTTMAIGIVNTNQIQLLSQHAISPGNPLTTTSPHTWIISPADAATAGGSIQFSLPATGFPTGFSFDIVSLCGQSCAALTTPTYYTGAHALSLNVIQAPSEATLVDVAAFGPTGPDFTSAKLTLTCLGTNNGGPYNAWGVTYTPAVSNSF
jgi:hypothetical protein